jgi:hypothetical protein
MRAGRTPTSASRSGSFYAYGRRIQVVRREGKEPVRVFEFGDMRFEIHISEKGDMDLQHIKVTIPDNPSRNAEVIHQFTILNKVRRRQLSTSDFSAAYEREVVNHYLQLQPDERDVVFNLLQAEYSSL